MSQPQQQQEVSESGQGGGSTKLLGGSSQSISFGTLMPMLMPALIPDQRNQLRVLYQKLKRTEISKEDFLRSTRLLVGDHLLLQTVQQVQLKQQQQLQAQRQGSQLEQPQQHFFLQHTIQQQQHLKQLPDQQSLLQPSSQVQESHDSSLLKSYRQEVVQAVSPQHSQHQLQSDLESKQSTPIQPQISPLASVPIHIQQTRQEEQYQEHQSQQSNQMTYCALNLQQHETGKQVPRSTTGIASNSCAQLSSIAPRNIPTGVADVVMTPAPTSIGMQGNLTQVPTMLSNNQVRTPPKKASSELKKAAETIPSMQTPSKKQKVPGGMLDQSIDQLNDVTAVSGVNLREEEEQLLTGPKEESRTSQVMRRFVQEEEGRFFLQKGPLQLKVAAIAAKFGVISGGEDVERCLSMSTEERLRNMLYKLIRLSSQRCDEEKERHKVIVTSDLRSEIFLIGKKAKEAQEKAEELERLQKLNGKKEKGVQQESTKEELRAKAQKTAKEEDEKMRAKAANVAARVAAGVDDMLMKWQMMAEQGRQKREEESGAPDGTNDNNAGTTNGSIGCKDAERKYVIGDAGPRMRSNIEGSASGSVAGGSFTTTRGSNQMSALTTQAMKVGHNISVTDVVAFLEREPQMAKSTLLYQLYARNHSSSQSTSAGGSK